MAKVIIGIHGLNNKPPKDILKNWWMKSLEEGLKNIGKHYALPKFELVYWADIIFDKPLDPEITDKKNPYYIDEVYIPGPETFRSKSSNFKLKTVKVVNKLFKKFFLNRDLSLKYSYIAESIVRRYFRELDIYYKEPCNDSNSHDNSAKQKIIDRLVSALQKYRKYDIFLISHSMGSIIAYDVLGFECPDTKVHTLVTIGSPLGMPLVISKIAQRQKKTYNDKTSLQTPPNVEHNWYNFSDIEDFISLNFKLADEFSQNDLGVRPTDFLVTNNYIINNKKNPHKSFGYLRTKELAMVLSAFIEEKKLTLLRKILISIKSLFAKFMNVFD